MKLKQLIERVRAIDEDAANYLEGDAKELWSYCDFEHAPNRARLIGLISWCDTPQGWDYWDKINLQLGE